MNVCPGPEFLLGLGRNCCGNCDHCGTAGPCCGHGVSGHGVLAWGDGAGAAAGGGEATLHVAQAQQPVEEANLHFV